MNQVDSRLEELKLEFNRGQQLLAELHARQDKLREQMLRISGAIQVLEELREASRDQPDNLRRLERPAAQSL